MSKTTAVPEGSSIQERLPEIKSLLALDIHLDFDSLDYYKTVFEGVDEEIAKEVHQAFVSFVNAKEGDKRHEIYLALIRVYWNLLGQLVRNFPQLNSVQRFALRTAILTPKILSDEQKSIFSRIRWENTLRLSFHYLDEWLELVGSGQVSPLGTDEPTRVIKPGGLDASSGELKQKQQRLKSKIDGALVALEGSQKQLAKLENELVSHIRFVQDRQADPDFSQIQQPYSSAQRQLLNAGMSNLVRSILLLDRDIARQLLEVKGWKKEQHALTEKLAQASATESGGPAHVDTALVEEELKKLQQIHKMTVGRKGNHLPVALKNYIPYNEQGIGLRERVIQIVREVEALDPGIFQRSYRGQLIRILPHFLLIPSYGELGFCWEAVERQNPLLGRGSVAIPMYASNLRKAVLWALADYRWSYIKDRASFRWMEEGLTGWYYQWFDENIKKGDIKAQFCQDYLLWLEKESTGVQVLDPHIRGIFWRNIPFPEEVREDLKKRSFIYLELYQKDINRNLSDGY